MVSSANPIVTVVSNSPMIVDAQVAERDVTRIRRGLTVDVTIDSLPGEVYRADHANLANARSADAQRNGGDRDPEPGRVLKGEMFARLRPRSRHAVAGRCSFARDA
jgi:multidrug efflux pump subunit AcrA (membrane-fusion protein)